MEGSGYTEHPDDRGGPTRYGITQGFLDNIGWPVSARKLTRSDAEHIYMAYFWIKRKASDLPPLVAWCWLDAVTNHGLARGSKLIQQALQVTPDGVVGPVTRYAAAQLDLAPKRMLFWSTYRRHRVDFYFDIVDSDQTQRVFLEGWMNRLFKLPEGMRAAGVF